MKESIVSVIANFKSFIGTGWLMWACFCIALLVCFFLGKEKRKKLFTVSLILCLLILNPLVYKLVGDRFLSGVYWRLFWTLPIVVVCAVVLTELAGRIKKDALRFVAVVILSLMVACLGKSVINRGTYTVAENAYQIPQAAIDVADIILDDSETTPVLVIAPDDLVCYIRQYTAAIQLAYGRDMWGFINTPKDWEVELYQLMHAEQIDFRSLSKKALEYGCSYVVFDENLINLPENLEKWGYTFVNATEHYRIYALEET